MEGCAGVGQDLKQLPHLSGRFVRDENPPISADTALGPSPSTAQEAGGSTGGWSSAVSQSELTVAALLVEIFFLCSSDAAATFAFLYFFVL